MYYIIVTILIQYICYDKNMNIRDYCVWRGDITFDIDPFNYVDNLVFSILSYYDFDEYFKNNEVYTIKQLFDLYSKDRQSDGLLKLIANTKRYSNLKVHNYVSILHKEKIEQFAALMIDLDFFTTIVSYRGTDDTLTGWNEDFRLSYTEIPAQKDALDYLNNSKFYKKYIVLGHSKGGHLALYASVKCNKNIQKRIIKVISNDGPGLSDGSYNQNDYENIKDRFIKIIPEKSLFGLLFENNEKRIVIKSSANGLEQHNMETWQVEGNKLVELDDTDDNSKLTKQVFDDFLIKTTKESRKIFIREYFNKLRLSDINTISDFASGDIIKILTVLKNINDVNDVAKDTTGILMKCFIDVYGSSFIKNVGHTVSNIAEGAVKQFEQIANLTKK